jgi:hypothetical protein
MRCRDPVQWPAGAPYSWPQQAAKQHAIVNHGTVFDMEY